MRKYLYAGLAGGALLATSPAKADLTFYFLPSNTFSGTAPAGSLSAVFHDVTPGVVDLTVTSQLMGTEFVLPGDGFYFNVNPALSPAFVTSINFAITNDPSSNGGMLSFGEDVFKPDGDGEMDMNLTFTSSKPFIGGQTETFRLTGTGTLAGVLDAADFDYPSDCTSGCGTGPHYAGVHIGNTPNGGSGSAWVGGATSAPVPEPLSVAMLGVAFAGVGTIARRRKRS